MKRHLVMMLCLIMTAASIEAQPLSGKLVDEKNEPLAYANVVLLSMPDSTFVSGTISDEMGGFRLSKDENGQLIRISSIGYATIYKKVNSGDFGVIQMTSDAQLLGEVVVKGNLPVTRVKGDALVTSVSGTLLEKAGTAEDLLDKIPNVTAQNGNVQVFGRGTPEIYINGRKVRDNTELDRLESDNIKSVEVINNPGARYDASVTSVIRINTKKAAGDGFGFNSRTYVSYNEKWTGLEQIDMNYRTGGFDFGGMVRYWNTYRIEDKVQSKYTYLDKEWKQDMNSVGVNQMKRLGTQFSVNYTFNPKHSIGIRHEFTRSPDTNADWTSDDEIYLDGQLE
ncbi:MAG: carboxypeptidase-like regulatory domain-containing protein, partial [Bacteroidaceae bacterium]|nr:carboxypeptidase-like regulatory domain-containing protein [Bacteroidaceae bacterium]